MTGMYLVMLQMGHFYCILVGFISQIELFRELVNVRYVEAKARAMPLFRTLQWSWFTLAMMYVYGGKFQNYCSEHIQYEPILQVIKLMNFFIFLGSCAVFMGTVATFKKDLIRFQVSQIFWTVVIIVIVVFQSAVFISNTMKGIFWFFFPMATVVMNDVAAYFCGITMGRKFISAPFLSISPNKTWEGFIGAGVLTVIFGFFFPLLLSQWEWFTCPLVDGIPFPPTPFPPSLTCEPNPVFVPVEYPFLGTVRPIQLHGLFYGLFASLVAPFGGFFASAIKRAYNKKDFDSFVPGHGGLMDRMDCQLVMIIFCYIHYQTFVKIDTPSIDHLVARASKLSAEDLQMLILRLQEVASGAIGS